MRVEINRSAPVPPIAGATIELNAMEAHDLRTIVSIPQDILSSALAEANKRRERGGEPQVHTYNVYGLSNLLAQELAPIPVFGQAHGR